MSQPFDRRQSNSSRGNGRPGSGRKRDKEDSRSRDSDGPRSNSKGSYQTKKDRFFRDDDSQKNRGGINNQRTSKGTNPKRGREERFRSNGSGSSFGENPLRKRQNDSLSYSERTRTNPRTSTPISDNKKSFIPGLPPGSNGEPFGDGPPKDLLWGRHTTQAALESGRPIHRIWCTSEVRSAPRFLQLLREAKSIGVLVEEVTWARLGQLTGGAVHQGIVLQIAAAESLDLKTLIEGCKGLDEPPLLLALDGLTDPQNLGAIVRSAEAMGAHGLVLPQRRSAGLTGSVAKVAAGALEYLPVARVVNLNRSLEALKKEGYRVVGLADEGDISLPEVDLEGPLVVVTGSEGQGLSLLTRRHCDQLVRIPLRGETPSLNASVATAMFLYEVARRSWMKEIRGQAPAPRIVRPKCSSSPHVIE